MVPRGVDATWTDDPLALGQQRWYRLVFVLEDGTVEKSRPLHVDAVDLVSDMRLWISGMRPALAIHYSLAHRARATLTVYDVRGLRCNVLMQGIKDAGASVVHWNGEDHRGVRLARGVYILRLEAAGRVLSRKFALPD